MPGVAAASMSTHTPLSGSTWSEAVVPAGRPLPNRDNAVFIGAGPAFSRRCGFRCCRDASSPGRIRRRATAVAVVNERYAQRHFPGRNPVGQHLTARLSGDTAGSRDRRSREEHEYAEPAHRPAGDRLPARSRSCRAIGWIGRPPWRYGRPAGSARSPRRCDRRCSRDFRMRPSTSAPCQRKSTPPSCRSG